MTLPDLLQDFELRSEPVKEPAKRWVNWFRTIGSGRFRCECGALVAVQDGDVGPQHCGSFASKDLAETRVVHLRRTWPDWDEHWCYLGAFPEGERP